MDSNREKAGKNYSESTCAWRHNETEKGEKQEKGKKKYGKERQTHMHRNRNQ